MVNVTQTKKEQKRLARQKTLLQIKMDKQLYFLFIPVFLYYVLFMYVPMFGLQIGFKDYSPIAGVLDSEWVGMLHFKNFFSSPYAWRIIRNTLMISFLDLLVNFTLTIVLAILLNEIGSKKIKSFVQTIAYMPNFISTVVVCGLVISMLSPSTGIINVLIEKLGFERQQFLYEPGYFRMIYTMTMGWKGIGFGTIIYSSAIAGIDTSLYEAASIDGAGKFRKIFNITIPGIMGTIVVMLIMRIGQLLSVGSEAIILLYEPITYETADVISSFVYRYGLENSDYSYSAAVGLFQSLIALILVVSANTVSKKVNDMGIW